MDDEDIVLYSSIAVIWGSLLVIFGAALHNRFSYSTSITDAVHLKYSVLMVILLGVAIAAIGVIGMVYGAIQRYL